jgi:hypothetical protein
MLRPACFIEPFASLKWGRSVFYVARNGQQKSPLESSGP